jgi:uncharacterized protein with PhoU and TrkA domain
VIGHDGGLAGLIISRDLLAFAAESAELGTLVNAWDLSRQHPPVLTLEANLDQAAQTMEYEGLEELPVAETESGAGFIGLVTRSKIAHAFNRVTLSTAALSTPDTSIFWASGYRVSRMQVPPGAVGRTLRDLEVRSRFGISVLAFQADSAETGFAPLGPDRPFAAGDRIIAAGSSAALRRFARELGD